MRPGVCVFKHGPGLPDEAAIMQPATDLESFGAVRITDDMPLRTVVEAIFLCELRWDSGIGDAYRSPEALCAGLEGIGRYFDKSTA